MPSSRARGRAECICVAAASLMIASSSKVSSQLRGVGTCIRVSTVSRARSTKGYRLPRRFVTDERRGAIDSPTMTRGIIPLYGHEELRDRLRGAASRRALPPTLLFQGMQGVGKQRLALWLAQLLLCEQDASRAPCNECTSCRFALQL